MECTAAIDYLAHQTHQQNRSPAVHHTNDWQAGTFHWHTETPPVGRGAWGWKVHRTPHLIGQRSLGGHHNAEPGSYMVHCRVGVDLLYFSLERLTLSHRNPNKHRKPCQRLWLLCFHKNVAIVTSSPLVTNMCHLANC